VRAHPKSAAFVRFAALIGAAGAILPLAAILGSRFGLIDWKFGLGTMVAQWTPWLAGAGVLLGVVALIVAFRDARRLMVWALIALIPPLLTMGLLFKFKSDAGKVPPIHDVATNWDKPLSFSRRIMEARRGSPNAVEADPVVPDKVGPPWGGRRIAEVNRETCPGAHPVMKHLNADQVAAAFEAAGVEVQGRAPWRVEGTYTSFWWGFRDDVVARIDPDRTDIRSISRVGMSDIGANCARVTNIVKALEH
jgi:fatty-acyl-CoA synthase